MKTILVRTSERTTFATCRHCGGKVSNQSKSGLCRKCSDELRIRVRTGEEHWNWKGGSHNNDPMGYSRAEARRLYPLDDVTCEVDKCNNLAKSRHHIDGTSNERFNIELLCWKHHVKRHGVSKRNSIFARSRARDERGRFI